MGHLSLLSLGGFCFFDSFYEADVVRSTREGVQNNGPKKKKIKTQAPPIWFPRRLNSSLNRPPFFPCLVRKQSPFVSTWVTLHCLGISHEAPPRTRKPSNTFDRSMIDSYIFMLHASCCRETKDSHCQHPKSFQSKNPPLQSLLADPLPSSCHVSPAKGKIEDPEQKETSQVAAPDRWGSTNVSRS